MSVAGFPSRFVVALAAALAAPGAMAAHAQAAPRIVDQGSFSITVGGQRAGREDFTIAATPRGQSIEYLARATIVYGDRRISPALMADSAGVPMQYEVTTRSAGDANQHWTGTIVRGRVSARIQTPRGQSAKEYIVSEGALILDDDVFHQYYFVARQRSAGSVTVVVPQRNAQLRLQVTTAGEERVSIGTQELEATHLVLTEPGGVRRDVWVDRQGRVLKVEIPARNLVAVRDDPPRQTGPGL